MLNPPHNTPNAARLGLLAACGAGFLWGTGALIVNVLMARHGFTPENISFWRFLVGAVVLLAVFARRSLWAHVRPHLGLVLLAGVAFSVASAVLYAGFTLVSGCLSQDFGAAQHRPARLKAKRAVAKMPPSC